MFTKTSNTNQVIIFVIIIFLGFIIPDSSLKFKFDLIVSNDEIINVAQDFSDQKKASANFMVAAESLDDIKINIIINSKKKEAISKPYSKIDYIKKDSYEFITDDGFRLNYHISKKMLMRDIGVFQVSVLPYFKDLDKNQIFLYNEFEVEVDSTYSYASSSKPNSTEFNNLLSSLLTNYSFRQNESNINPSILYICGGNSINQASFEELILWRKQLGYDVNTVSTSELNYDRDSIKNYIQNAYQDWPNPPEYVVLVGDTDGSYQIPFFSSTGGSSDYDYSLLEGDDLLPEIIIGRISAQGQSDLTNIINKTLAYEKASFLNFTGSDWYDRAALVADPSSSGNSTIITNEYIENLLQIGQFGNIQTNYGAGNYSYWMQNELSQGLLYFNYRGYIGTSGFGSSNLQNANNGYMTPFATFITCSTGDFNYTSLSEDFVRVGSATNPKGAVAAVGTATSSTHTAPNNIVQMGIYSGIFTKNIQSAGGALVNGKLSLYNSYNSSATDMINNFSRWNNLIGDPALKLWTSEPKQMIVDHSQSVSIGSNFFQVSISDIEGYPVENALVTIFDEYSSESFTLPTNESGAVYFEITIYPISDLFITVSKKNFVPYQSQLLISNFEPTFSVDSFYVVEPQNSQDGYINIDETVDIFLNISNQSEFLDSFNVSSSVLTDNASIANFDMSFEINESATIGPFQINPNSINNQDLISVIFNISNEFQTIDFIVNLEVRAPSFHINEQDLLENLHPGDSIDLSMSLSSDMLSIGNQYEFALISSNNNVEKLNNYHIFNSTNNYETFLIEPISFNFSNNIINGSVINFFVEISSENFYQSIPFSATVGIADSFDPFGPDEYGYYIYDNLDYGYELTPIYNWIEIDPSIGGNGTDLLIFDSGNGVNIQNSTKTIDLPFEFCFYGECYAEVSISSNGWISFGLSSMESFRNYPLPGPGGPSPMIAAFWDDLVTSNDSGIFSYFDEINDIFIIEWSNMRTFNQNSIETFQILLLNTNTPSGDGEIKIQYKDFNNTSSSNSFHPVFSTIGIENHTGEIGLEYSYNNQYPNQANPITNQSAIFITTKDTNVYNLGDVNQDSSTDVLDIVLIVNHILNIQNLNGISEYLADTSQNSGVNILDVILLINMILEG